MASRATVLLLPLWREQLRSRRGSCERSTWACQGWALNPTLCANVTGSRPSRRSSTKVGFVIVLTSSSAILRSLNGHGLDRLCREQCRDHVTTGAWMRRERMEDEAPQVLPLGAASDVDGLLCHMIPGERA